MKRRYLRLVRRAYRHLRHPRIRRIKWLTPLITSIFNKRYWSPCRHTVSNGLSIGLFCAMLPIPFQMLLATLGCLRARGNVPFAIAACWITNPVTQIPFWFLQEQLGGWMHNHMEIPKIPLISSFETLIPVPELTVLGHTFVSSGEVMFNGGNFVTGFLVAGCILAMLAYPLVYGICLFLPNRGKAHHCHE